MTVATETRASVSSARVVNVETIKAVETPGTWVFARSLYTFAGYKHWPVRPSDIIITAVVSEGGRLYAGRRDPAFCKQGLFVTIDRWADITPIVQDVRQVLFEGVSVTNLIKHGDGYMLETAEGTFFLEDKPSLRAVSADFDGKPFLRQQLAKSTRGRQVVQNHLATDQWWSDVATALMTMPVERPQELSFSTQGQYAGPDNADDTSAYLEIYAGPTPQSGELIIPGLRIKFDR